MKQNKLAPVAFSLAHVVFSLLRVLAAIGAVFLLIGILSLSFLPGGTVRVDTHTKMEMNFNLKPFFGETWKEYKDTVLNQLGEGLTPTEEGFAVEEEVVSQTLENRAMALSLIPTFASLLIQFFFYGALAKMGKELKLAPFPPISSVIPEQMKALAYSLFALGAVPALVSSLISLITGFSAETDLSFDLEKILWGLIVLAVSQWLEPLSRNEDPERNPEQSAF